MELYGSIKLNGSLESGTNDPLLTRDATTNAVGTVTSSIGTLPSAQIFVGNASNVATAVAVSGDITISNTGVVAIASGVIVNADINASAAIAYSKLNLASSIVNADVSNSAAIAYSKLNLSTSIVNADISASAAIARTKLASGTANRIIVNNGSGVMADASAITANRALISDGSGIPTHATTTATQLGYLSTTTSDVQTQLNNRLTVSLGAAATGDIIYYNGSAWTNLPRGTNGQALYSTAGSIQWNTPTINGIPVGGTAGQVLAKNSGTDFDASWATLTTASITDISASAAELNILDGATISTTELNYLDNVSSNIQTQLDGKLSTALAQNALFVGNSSNVATSLAAGTNGYVLTSVSGVPTWAASSAGSPPGSDTQVIFNDAGSFGADAGMVFNKTTNVLTVGRVVGSPTATLPGVGVGSYAGDPSSLSNGDLWYNSTDNILKANISLGPVNVVVTGAVVNNAVPYLTTAANQPYLNQSNQFTYNSSTRVLTSGIIAAAHTTEAGIRVNNVTADPASLSNGYMWYNSTDNALRARINGATVALGTGISGITVGTTTITSGTSTRIPFNDGGVYGEDSAFTWDKTNNALSVNAARIHSTGTRNTFAGESSGNFTLTATDSVAIGTNSLTSVTSGVQNVAIGTYALTTTTTGDANTIIGWGAARYVTGRSSNTAIGAAALGGATFDGASNTVIGALAGSTITTGDSNVIIGYNAGTNLTTGDSNVIIGTSVNAQSATASGQLSIQNAVFGSSNTSTGTTVSSGNLGFYATSWGTSAAKVIAVGTGTAPSGGNPADAFQMYSADIAAGNAAAHFQTELGDVVKLYSIGGWGTPSGTLTRTTFDSGTVTLAQLAERVAALITDLKTNHGLLKA